MALTRMRFAAGIEYDGSGFAGWQTQAHAVSVQATVEAALSRIADEPVATVCAGRTDAGVHATSQVIHFDTTAVRPERAWVLGGNTHLPDSVRIRWVRPVEEGFHARFWALSRAYRYVILSRPVPSALHRHRVAWTYRPLDVARMSAAAACLLGEHDFSSFRAAGCQAHHPVRRLERLTLRASGDYVYLDIEANAFLHHMVRNIAGSLMMVGAGERPVDWLAEVLTARDRCAAGVTAAPGGLYLCAVRYPAAHGLPGPGDLPVFA